MNGAPLAAVHGLYGALFGLRVVSATKCLSLIAAPSSSPSSHTSLGPPARSSPQAHAEFGLRRPGRIGSGRAVGTLGTYAVIVAAGLISKRRFSLRERPLLDLALMLTTTSSFADLSLSWDYLLSSLNLK